MKIDIPSIKLGTEGVKFDLLVKRKNGDLKKVYSGKNLILDTGMSLWGSNLTANLTFACAVGDDTTPVERDSSTTTASRSGTTVTASAGFFEAADVGRLLKFDSGEEAYIQTFNSSTSVETVSSGTIASSEFTVYYVDQTGPLNELARTSTKRTDSGDNETTVSAGVINHKRTHLFPAEAAPVTYQEIGWSTSGTGGANCFNRAIISGGVSLGIGDQLIVVSNLEIIQSPQTATAQSDVGTGGFNSAGLIQLEGYGHSAVPSNGSNASNDSGGIDNTNVCFEPRTSGSAFNTFGLSVTGGSHNSYGSVKTLTALASNTISNGALTDIDPSTKRRLKTTTFGITAGNSSNINSIYLGANGSQVSALRLILTNPQTKLNTQTLSLSFACDYGRVLTNS